MITSRSSPSAPAHSAGRHRRTHCRQHLAPQIPHWAPTAPQRLPKAPHETPLGAPRAPPSPPGAPQELPKGRQRTPKSLPKALNGTHRLQKAHPATRKLPQTLSRAPLGTPYCAKAIKTHEISTILFRNVCCKSAPRNSLGDPKRHLGTLNGPLRTPQGPPKDPQGPLKDPPRHLKVPPRSLPWPPKVLPLPPKDPKGTKRPP